jgi:hypothetical protein
MAQKRMIDKKISISEQANNLDDGASLLFTWMVPHADDAGLLPYSSRQIKGLVIPLRDITVETVGIQLESICKEGLITPFEYDGQKYWKINKFHEFQILQKDRNPQTLFFFKKGKDIKDNWDKMFKILESNWNPTGIQLDTEVKRSEEKRNEDKRSEAKLKEESVREKPIIPPASPSGSPFTKEEQEILNTPEDKKFSSKCERLEEIEKLQHFKSGLKAKGLMFLMFFLLVLPVHATTVSINYQISLSPAKAYKLVLKEPSISPPKQALKTTGSGGSKTFEGYTLEEIVNKVAILESGDGKEVGLHGYCLRQGGTNKYGYLPTPTFCFKTEEEAKLTISKWFAKRLDKRPLYDCLCEYNLGKKGLVNCMYYQHFISI